MIMQNITELYPQIKWRENWDLSILSENIVSLLVTVLLYIQDI